MSRYANKRMMFRQGNGRFRAATGKDFGIGGVCPTPGCGHLLLQHYDGDPREGVDPRKFVYRCFTCNPLTEAELKLQAEIEASKPKRTTFEDIFRTIEEGTK